MWLWHVKMATQNLLKLLLLLKLMMRNVSTTVWLQIWKVNFGHKIKFLFGLWGQGFKVCSRFWSWCSGKILKLKFGHYFAADAWLWLWSSFLVEILVWFGQDFILSFDEMVMFGWDFEVGARSRFWRCLIKICVWTCDMTQRSYFGK